MPIGSPGIFPKTVGNIIYAADFNNIQSTAEFLLGAGLSDSGYGQAVGSAQVASDDIVTVSQWNALRTDLLKIRQHQTGINESLSLTLPTTSDVIDDAFANQYKDLATLCSTNRLTVALTEAPVVNLYDPVLSTRTSPWNGLLTHTVEITFASGDAGRQFFNSGGSFQFSATITGYTGGTNDKGGRWDQMLTAMGTIKFAAHGTTYTGTDAAGGYPKTSIGWYELTTSDQYVFVKPTTPGVYLENEYRIKAKKNVANNTATVLTFTIEFNDADVGDQRPGYKPGPGVDENVTGSLASIVKIARAASSNVTVPSPAYTSNFSGLYTAPPLYTINAATLSVNEGSSLLFDVGGANITDGTYYWTITNTGDFGSSSGSFTITGNIGSFSVTPTIDTTSEGAETFTASVRTSSTSGTVVATSSAVTINDTSRNSPSYNITPAASSVNEGSSLTFNVTGLDIINGTYYWTATNSGDFTISSGSFIITSDVGSFSVTPTADTTTEGAETFTVSVRTGSTSGTVVATSSAVTINDTSLTTTYSVTPTSSNVNEGSSLTFNVSGSNITNGNYYWTVTNSGDFGTNSGSFTITSNTGSFSVTPTADATTEGSETFTASVRTGSTSGTVVATSSSVTINDTSTTGTPTPPTPTITFNSSGYNQYVRRGSTISASFSATGGTAPYSYAITGTTPGTARATGSTCGYSGVASILSTSADFSYTITATDALGFTGTLSQTVRVYGISGQTAFIGTNTNGFTFTSSSNAFALSNEGGNHRRIVVTASEGFAASGADNNPFTTMTMTVGGTAYTLTEDISWGSFLSTRVHTGIFSAIIPVSAGNTGTLSVTYSGGSAPGHKYFRAYSLVSPTSSIGTIDVNDTNNAAFSAPLSLSGNGSPQVGVMSFHSFNTGGITVSVTTTGLETVNTAQQNVENADWRVYNLAFVESTGATTSQTITMSQNSGTVAAYAAATYR
jgi:hypothetical protein